MLRPPAHSAGNRARAPDLLPTHLVPTPPAPAAPIPSLAAQPHSEVSLPLIILAAAATVLLGIVVYLLV